MTVRMLVSPIIFVMSAGLFFSPRCDAPVWRNVKKSAFLPVSS
jgi:hypothetical protein